ncbi:amino acid ABC transporter permease [Rhodovulum sp. DZ06]|uniref:amino acid ABC transporter permease n=1 Tax=Rhodovulum sp. DZ06 TaxID=3425126 RepID=UPI003D33042E
MTDNNVAWVAEGSIPPSPPPAGETGPIRWARENLFLGPVNSVITIVASIFITWGVLALLQWAVFDAVVNASSLAECREVNPHGACWAVIVERFDQFLFGFYPEELRWRPSLAFALLLVALYFALTDNAPFRAQGLIFAGVYPLIAFFLIWGGPILSVLAFAAGITILFAAVIYGGRFIPTAFALPIGAVAAVAWLLFIPGLFASSPGVDFVGPGLEEVESRQLGGFLLALIIGVAGIVLSLPIGVLLALGRRSGLFFIQTLCVVFIEFIRGVPLITLLFVANSVLAYFFPPGSSLDLILRVVIMVTMFASAYMAEVIRGGLAALPSGQQEAADSLGLDYWKSIRLIIMPQALKISIPNIVSTFIGLFKDTTLVVVIGLLDPIGLISAIRGDSNWNGIVWEFYVFVGAFFFVVCFAMSRYSQYLERKLATDHR